MSEARVTIRLRSRLVLAFTVAGAALGGVAALLIGPGTTWLLEWMDREPPLLQQLDQLRLAWSVPVLMVLGKAAGLLISSAKDRSAATLSLDAETVTMDQQQGTTVFRHSEICDAFLDDEELVLLGRDSRELTRAPTEDGLASELKEAFRMFGLPWSGTITRRS